MIRHKHYDVAIIGLGSMGSFAAVELAKRGRRVAGFDQFKPPHDRGSHSGTTRIYRVAYAEARYGDRTFDNTDLSYQGVNLPASSDPEVLRQVFWELATRPTRAPSPAGWRKRPSARPSW